MEAITPHLPISPSPHPLFIGLGQPPSVVRRKHDKICPELAEGSAGRAAASKKARGRDATPGTNPRGH